MSTKHTLKYRHS